MIEEFFKELDVRCKFKTEQVLEIYLTGKVALFFQGQNRWPKKKITYLVKSDLDTKLLYQLAIHSGPNSSLARKHHYWLEREDEKSLLLPSKPVFHEINSLNSQLRHIKLFILDKEDVLITKTKFFTAEQTDEIYAAIKLWNIEPAHLAQRFQSALLHYNEGRWLPDMESYVSHFHTIQRDFLLVAETTFKYPSRIETLEHPNSES
jgi:hypothetical protein